MDPTSRKGVRDEFETVGHWTVFDKVYGPKCKSTVPGIRGVEISDVLRRVS